MTYAVEYTEIVLGVKTWHSVVFQWNDIPKFNGKNPHGYLKEVSDLRDSMMAKIDAIRTWTYANVPMGEFSTGDYSYEGRYGILFQHKHHAMLCKLEMN